MITDKLPFCCMSTNIYIEKLDGIINKNFLKLDEDLVIRKFSGSINSNDNKSYFFKNIKLDLFKDFTLALLGDFKIN